MRTEDTRQLAPTSVGTPGGLPQVRLVRLSKTFRGPRNVQAVHDVSLEVAQGEIFTLLGPSGCGKTTTLRIIAGLETPDAGELYFLDRLVASPQKGVFVPPNKRNVGMVFQSYAIWPHMTVFENVAYPLKVSGVPSKKRRERVLSALKLVGLEGLGDRPAPLLSGGQQQRVALARALVYEPDVLLLDEPFSNLDAKLREHMRMELKVLQKRLGITVIFVTHDQLEALTLADHIAVLNSGRVEQVENPQELYTRPATPFVRDFLGRVIVLTGEARQTSPDGTRAWLCLDGADDALFPALCDREQAPAPGRRITVSVRPEDVELLDPSHPAPGECLIGTIEVLAYVGERYECRISMAGQAPFLVYAPYYLPLREGARVHLRLRPDALRVWAA